MLAVYNTAAVCAYNEPFRCGLRLQPDLTDIMARSRNWDEMQYIWMEWRRNTGQKYKDSYEQLVSLSNDAAKLNSKLCNCFFSCSTNEFDSLKYSFNKNFTILVILTYLLTIRKLFLTQLSFNKMLFSAHFLLWSM